MPTPASPLTTPSAPRVTKRPAATTRIPVTICNDSTGVTVPEWVCDFESFRRWVKGDDLPERFRIWYLQGEVWIDMSKEQIFSHVLVKTEYTIVLGSLAKRDKIGLYLTDGVLLSNVPADLSGNPDGIFVLNDALDSGRVRLGEGAEGGYVELEGSPDMTLEIVSTSSITKDNRTLRQAYWHAGIREYWLVDARREPIVFDIFRHTARGYVPARKRDGWIKSVVFGKSFRLTHIVNARNLPEFSLEVR
jgi:Uma2 family endonuclease